MSNSYEHELFEAIKELEVIALRAYWSGRVHCGGDFNLDSCPECKHHNVCQATVKLNNHLEQLVEWGC